MDKAVKELKSNVQYEATYVRRSLGSTYLDNTSVNAATHEYVVADTLDELEQMLNIIAINQKGFSVLTVEKITL